MAGSSQTLGHGPSRSQTLAKPMITGEYLSVHHRCRTRGTQHWLVRDFYLSQTCPALCQNKTVRLRIKRGARVTTVPPRAIAA